MPASDPNTGKLVDALHTLSSASGGTPQLAKALLDKFSDQEWVRLGAIDFAAEARFRFRRIMLKENGTGTALGRAGQMFGQVALLSADAATGTLHESAMVYGDSGRVVCLRPPLPDLRVITRDPSLLLLALAYMRYHADNITVLPGKLRHQESEHLAHQFRLPIHHLVVLAECLPVAHM
ncbi:MAG: hypothetical protein ACYTFA_12195 [Planctomycetota bacterium]